MFWMIMFLSVIKPPVVLSEMPSEPMMF